MPFENLGLLPYFEVDFIATASDVLEAENMYPQARPLGKPNPFSYIAALMVTNAINMNLISISKITF